MSVPAKTEYVRDKKDARVNLRISEDQKRLLEAKAAFYGMSLSSFMVAASLRACRECDYDFMR